MNKERSNIKLSSYDDIFDKETSIQESVNSIVELSLNDLCQFENHPFHVNVESDEFIQLKESIEENNVIYPIIVRPFNGKYEILSGHCRVEACRQLGKMSIPAKICDVDDFMAAVIMTHTNINGRDKISVSEKAKAYRMCMDLEKHQGINKGEETAQVIGAGKDSTRQVYRFVRLSYLIPELLEAIDKGRLSVQIGHEIAYLREENQRILYRFCDEIKSFPDIIQVKKLKEMDKNDEISYESIVSLLAKPVKKPMKVSFKISDLNQYFTEDTEPEKIEDVIIQLLQKYKNGEVEL